MRDADVIKPAMSRAEAAMLVANVRTICGGAALKCAQTDVQHWIPETSDSVAVEVVENEIPPAQAADAALHRMRALRRAAFRQLMDQRTKIWVR